MSYFKNVNFNFLLWPTLKYVLFMLGGGFVIALTMRVLLGWLPRKLLKDIIALGLGVGVVAGLYVCARWFSA